MSGRRFDQFRPHPWHGLSFGPDAPGTVEVYVELTPFDTVKYEIDKRTGYLRVDRPQSSSALPSTLYGFVPQTYCGERVAALTPGAERGDGDPLDICVLSEQRIDRAEILVSARIVGGVQVLDGGEADDKIVAVLSNDPVFASMSDLTDVPPAMLRRLVHYFATYKMDVTGGGENPINVIGTYDVAHAHEVMQASIDDYHAEFVA
ncbi:MAG: inorganic pyrophosphatase [Desertimonas sp.]